VSTIGLNLILNFNIADYEYLDVVAGGSYDLPGYFSNSQGK
jgi:hypothetical protein